jgi:hypothetical protein
LRLDTHLAAAGRGWREQHVGGALLRAEGRGQRALLRAELSGGRSRLATPCSTDARGRCMPQLRIDAENHSICMRMACVAKRTGADAGSCMMVPSMSENTTRTTILAVLAVPTPTRYCFRLLRGRVWPGKCKVRGCPTERHACAARCSCSDKLTRGQRCGRGISQLLCCYGSSGVPHGHVHLTSTPPAAFIWARTSAFLLPRGTNTTGTIHSICVLTRCRLWRDGEPRRDVDVQPDLVAVSESRVVCLGGVDL